MPELRLLVHLEGIGDVVVGDGVFGGTRGESRRLEGFQLDIPGFSCEYMAHLESTGDTSLKTGGTYVGTRGVGRRLEGFSIALTGPLAINYSIIYMAHLQDTADTPFYSDGAFCGTRGESRRVEGILVHIEER